MAIIRKLRKKLRQIENLERLQRQLTDDELAKIYLKEELRKQLSLKLADGQQRHDPRSLDKKPIKSAELSEKLTADATSKSKAESNVTSKTSSQQNIEITKTDLSSRPSKQAAVEEKSSVRKRAKITNPWLGRQFQVRYLKGHADVITCMVVHQDILVTGSRDTTLKLWDAADGNLTISMGGHTGPVTALVMLPADDPRYILDSDQSDTLGRGRKIISGSTDCSLRIWALDTGLMLTRIYTYSPVQCIDYRDGIIATGSDAGKIELWDLDRKESICSVISFNEELLTSVLFCEENYLAASSTTGLVKVWDTTDQTLTITASSDEANLWTNDKMMATKYKFTSRINAMANKGTKLYWGDENRNIKVFDFQNVRETKDDKYLCSIDEGATERIMSTSCTFYKDKLLRICTGGSHELRIWDQLEIKKDIKESNWVMEGFRHSLGMQVGDLSSASCVHHDNFSVIVETEDESDSESEDIDDDGEDGAEQSLELEEKDEKNSYCLIL
ncbi:uncharacterized protein TRIADDRAFT_57562 [Trichoplax adhaerens]|uniref:Uncharacterized protein n=1 Tax=Trichoplax adhaerens TaxID=10228 RepID=B3RZS7_TRIAD|nr:hypothetical protein TRIADDRAFT_57562 [Trichoplax adhaerens]EDV23891.1 hypothetical protein TRIADDRAFT_57562 [Trichoplax adhaerens]|eukprot:XP_002113417.1 hypothetical protein TRIADDRAFT_57562 [Trichoplax adhaerens]